MEPWHSYIEHPSDAALLQGLLFTGSIFQQALANAGVVSIRIKAGAKAELLKMAFLAMGECKVDIYEGTTYTANGTQETIENRNLGSANACNAIAYLNPTVNALGSYHFTQMIPASSAQGSGGVRAGSVSPDSFSFMMNANSDLLFQITNISGSAADVNAVFTLAELP